MMLSLQTTTRLLFVTRNYTQSSTAASEPFLIREISTEKQYQNFLKETQEKKAGSVIKFTAKWCAPCKQSEVSFHQLAEELNPDKQNKAQPQQRGAALFGIVDVDAAEQAMMDSFNISVVPTFIIKHQTTKQQNTILGFDPRTFARDIREGLFG